MAEKHYLQFIDSEKVVHEVQTPAVFEGIARVFGVEPFNNGYVLRFELADGTKPMIQMPSDYSPQANWLYGGYRKESAR